MMCTFLRLLGTRPHIKSLKIERSQQTKVKMNTTPPTDSNQVWLASRNPNTTAAGDTEATSEEELFYGRWTKEEETYALELIRSFGEGTLENVPDGATLRNFLAEKLTCQAKRISKKYEGSHYNGRQRFARTNAKANANELDAKRRHIAELRKTFEEARQKSQEKTRQRRSSRKRKQKAPPPTAQTAATLTFLQQDQTRPPAAVSAGSATTAASFAAATSAQQMPPAGLQADVGSLQQDVLSRRLAEVLVQQRLNSLQASLAPSFSTGAGGGFASFGAFPHSSHLAAGLNLGSNENTYMASNSGISELLTRAGLAGLTSAAPASSAPSSQISNEILLNLTRGLGAGAAGMSTREILLRQALHVPASGLGGGGIDTLLAQIGLSPHLLPLPPPREAGLFANMNRSGDAMNLFASAAPLPAAAEPSPPPTAVSSQEPDVVKTSFSPWTTTPAESFFFY